MKIKVPEKEVLSACLHYLTYVAKIECWRNNTMGTFNKKSGGYFFHGRKGVSDILGILDDGRFFACECKSSTGKMSPDQDAFQQMIANKGGVAVCVSSVDELIADLKEAGL